MAVLDHCTLGSADEIIPVLIVGAGPTGLLQSYLLSRLGIRNLVIEKYPKRLAAPKAHALNPRSLEICRQFGLDMNRIRSLGTQRDDAFWVNFSTTLREKYFGRLPYERMDVDVLEDTPEMIHNIPQPHFEQYLWEELSRQTNVEIVKGVSFESLEQTSEAVISTVRGRMTGQSDRIRSKYVIGCDGAKSRVRNSIGIDIDGEDSYETLMTIHFSADLRTIVGESVGMLHWLFDPQATGFVIAYDLSHNAVLITNFDSERHPVNSWSENLCYRILHDAIGEDIAPKVLSYRPWILSRKVAKDYRKGNVFLAGDAAHSFPPTGGLGLNSGLADVHNLAFKLSAVHHGAALPSSLESYGADRRQVAEINSRQSVRNGQKIFKLLKTLGMTGTSDVEIARRNLHATIQDERHAKQVAAAIEEQREHFDNLNLHIGYVYGEDSIPSNASKYEAQFVPGARFPHTWLSCASLAHTWCVKPASMAYVKELSEEEVEAKRYSTLDLFAFDAWTFILAAKQNTAKDIVSAVKGKYPALKFHVFGLEEDFSLLAGGGGNRWLFKSGLRSGKWYLVRPDQHILLRLSSESTEVDITSALNQFLGLID